MTFKFIIDEITKNIDHILDELEICDVQFSVEPARSGFGDVSSNVSFLLAGKLKMSPGDVAQMLSQKYAGHVGPLVARCNAHKSGYLNFFADWPKLAKLILVRSHDDDLVNDDNDNTMNVIVEHTSVNPNKALHIGHVRNIVIGDVTARILKSAGHEVSVLNYVDDSGLQVADIIVGFRHLGFDLEPPDGEKKFDQYCGDDVYVQTTQRYTEDPGLEEVRRRTLQELEDANSQTAAFADMVTQRVLRCQLETCWNLGVSYDCINFESQILRSGLWERAFEMLKEMGLVEFEGDGKNAGCWVIRGKAGRNNNNDGGPAKKPSMAADGGEDKARDANDDKVIVRSNGTATYIAKDIPYAAWKLGLLEDPFRYVVYVKQQPSDPSKVLWQTVLAGSGSDEDDRHASSHDIVEAPTTTDGNALHDTNYNSKPIIEGQKVITVIDSRQARLQQIISDLMGRFKSVPDAYIHLGYESVTLSADTADMLGINTDGRQAQMSGRKGLYVNADSVYETLKTTAGKETHKRHPEMSEHDIHTIAHAISVGTIRYEMIKQDLDKIITFDMATSLRLEGDTAPYVQYTGARATRILERAGNDDDDDAHHSYCLPDPKDVDFSLLVTQPEKDLVRMIGLFDIQVMDAANNLSPKVIARYCHDLAVIFNAFYEKARVLGLDDKALEASRLYLVRSFRTTLERALAILGIAAPSVM